MKVEIEPILKRIENGGLEAAIVGGAVRDILTSQDVHDWDVTTNAKPEEILKIFPDAFYNNRFGTVSVPFDNGFVEVTTYRTEKSYSDRRHPDDVVWGKSLEEDLMRRDFTVNAMAFRFMGGKIDDKPVDLFGGQVDLKKKLIRTVGDANARFGEDALRMLRAIRFAATLSFEIEEKTKAAIAKNAKLLSKISGERIREELFKIIASENSSKGLYLARDTKLLSEFLPELEVCFAVEQKSPKRHHVYDVGTHCVMSLEKTPSKDITTRFATLLHDIGKAKVADVTEEGVRTFYNHEVVGARQATKIADRLHMSAKEKDKLFKLVRWHQFSVGEDQTDKAIRRFIVNVGLENVNDMLDLRVGDRLGGGLEEPEGWRLKLFKKRIDDVLKKPFTVADLKINGKDVMRELNIKPGPEVGKILNQLFEEVVDDKNKNNKEYLTERLNAFK